MPAAPPPPISGASSLGAPAADAAASAAKLLDEALAAAQALKEEAASVHAANAERRQQLQEEIDLLKTAAAAAQERVRAAAATLAQERAQADALERRAAALRERLLDEARRDDDDDDRSVSVSSEAEAVAHLHRQAAAVQNIRDLVPIVLDLQSSNYSKWREYLLLTLGRYALKDHVLSDTPLLEDPAWARMDYVVLSWLFTSVSPDILDIIHEHGGTTARAAWLGIEQQSLNNRERRILLLEAEFRTISQGALSVDDYCRKMKSKADALADLGEPVTDRTLVLNVLQGLNERFQFMAQFVTRQRPFPSFGDVQADLRLAELSMAQPPAPPSAIVASSTSRPPASSTASAPTRPPPGPLPGGAPSGGGSGRRRRGRRGHGGHQGGQNSQGSLPGGSQWPSHINPWTGSIHMWPGGPRAPPPRPWLPGHHQQAYMAGQHHQQALMAGPPPSAMAPPQYTGLQAPPSWTPWDPQSLTSAFSTVTLTPPGIFDWVVDSGATSHITSSSGSAHWGHPPLL